MSLQFSVGVEWSGSGRQGAGAVSTGGQRLEYSAPESMGGMGAGSSPEELLLAAVSSCYSATLFRILERRNLPALRLEVTACGYIEDYPQAAHFARIVVHPTVLGADADRLAEYQDEAVHARDACFIGRVLRGNVTYDVGEVQTAP